MAIKLSLAMSVALPAGVVVAGIIKNIDLLAVSLKDLLNSSGIKAQPFVVALASHLVESHNVSIAADVLTGELEEQIYLAYEQQITEDIADCQLDYQFLQQNDDEHEFIVASCPKTLINDVLALASKLKLQLQAIDVAKYALANLYNWENTRGSDSKNIALLGVSALGIDLLVLEDAEVGYQQFIPLSSSEEVASHAKYPSNTKKNTALVASQPGATKLNKAQKSLFLNAITETFANLERDGHLSAISSIELHGDAAINKALQTSLAKSLQLPVLMTDPFKRLDITSAKISGEKSEYLLATALALRGVGYDQA